MKITTALDELNTSKGTDSDTKSFLRDIKAVYKNMLTAFESTCNQLSERHISAITKHYDHIQNASIATYEQKLIEISTKHIQHFDTELQMKLGTYTSKINLLDKRLKDITTKMNTVTVRAPPVPTTPKSKSSIHTPQKPSAVSQTPSIQQYFHQNTLKFEHQGDEYFLQDKDFIKNSPKIQPPTLVDDALTIYSQLQKNANIYNIFITPIDRITIWDHSPLSIPTTCMFSRPSPM